MFSCNLTDCLRHSPLKYKEDREQVHWIVTVIARDQSTCSEVRLRELGLLSLENRRCWGGLNDSPPGVLGGRQEAIDVTTLKLDRFRLGVQPWLEKALSNLVWPCKWPCFMQEVCLETSCGPSWPELSNDLICNSCSPTAELVLSQSGIRHRWSSASFKECEKIAKQQLNFFLSLSLASGMKISSQDNHCGQKLLK